MTYAVALRLERGIVFAADTRTSAGVDNISQFRKLHFWRRPGDRVLVLLTAGNLAITQSVVSVLNEAIARYGEGRGEETGEGRDKGRSDERGGETAEGGPEATLMSVPSMYRAARLVGNALREVRALDGASLEASKAGFSASLILGGQIGTESPRLFQIYSEGNFIEATDDTPFFQIGEHKYGKPILDRVTQRDMRLGEAAKLILLSFDSTLRSNLSVGMPLDLLVYERDTLDVRTIKRIHENDEYFRRLSSAWSEALRSAVTRMEEFKG